VDWAGDTVPIYNRNGEEALPASIFVAVLGAKHLHLCTCCSWTRDGELGRLPRAALLVPDNPRTGATGACRYEPDLNRIPHEVAQYYNIAVMPASHTNRGTSEG